jgi:WD40 repeat protein
VVSPGAMGSGLFVPIDCPANRDTLLALNPHGTRLAVSCERSDSVRVVDPGSGGEVTRLAGFQNVSGIEFLSAEVLLVTASDGCFRCDLRRGEREVLLSEAGLTRSTVSPNGRIVAVGVRSGLALYDVRRNQVLRRLQAGFAHWHHGNRVAFSASGHYVAAELRPDDRDFTFVVIWDARDGRRQRVFDTGAYALAFREDTMALAVADDNGGIRLYEPDQGEEPAAELRVDRMACALQFRNGGRRLAVLMWGGGFVEVGLATGRVVRSLPPPAARETYDVVASADWSLFAGAAEGGVVIWPGDRAEPSAA